MGFYEACKIAYEYYKTAWNIEGLSEIKDLGEKWLFFPKSEEVFFGNSYITISKDNGELESFILPDDNNFRLLRESIVMNVPNDFLI